MFRVALLGLLSMVAGGCSSGGGGVTAVPPVEACGYIPTLVATDPQCSPVVDVVLATKSSAVPGGFAYIGHTDGYPFMALSTSNSLPTSDPFNAFARAVTAKNDTLTLSNLSGLSWTSSDPLTVSISQSGFITVYRAGVFVTLTATFKSFTKSTQYCAAWSSPGQPAILCKSA